MSKKKTEAEMRAIAEMIKNMVKDWHDDDFDDEAETEGKENYPNKNCEDCEYWDEDCHCCDGDCDEEDENREEDENEYYRHNECEDHDGDCEDCSYYNEDDCCCELDDEDEEDRDEEEDEEENTQIEDLSKFITSIGTVLGGDMGLLVFDKSNKKDMEKLAAIFGEYAKRL